MVENLIETTLDELIKGYKFDEDQGKYVCSVCGQSFEEGEVFRLGDRYFSSEKMIKMHMQNEHGDMLGQLMNADKKYTGLTENQIMLLKMIRSGMSDAEMAKKTGVAAATIRHQRFTFREKAKQAKLYLAIYELAFNAKESAEKFENDKEKILDIHKGATMLDDRYCITIDEEKQVLETMFSSLSPLQLKTFPAKQKKKIVVLKKISEQFGHNMSYTEVEINNTLKDIYYDFATIRRYLIEYGFLKRTNDCKEYRRG